MVATAARPDAERALREKYRLAAHVLDDIGLLAAETAPSAGFVIAPMLEQLHQALERDRNRDAGRVVGPELYRWLALAGSAARQGEVASHRRAIAKLPGLLLTRLVTTEQTGSHWLPLRDGVAEFPQAGFRMQELAREQSLAKVRWDRTSLFVQDVEVEREWLCDQVDGASEETPRLAGSGIYFHQRGIPVAEMVEDLRRTASVPVGRDEEIALIPLDQFDSSLVAPIVGNMGQGLALVRALSPDHAGEIESVMDAITLVSGRRFVGGSDIWYHGVAVLNPDLEWSSTTYADHLIHEGAHLALHASNELSPLLVNGAAMGARSPIREDPRPLYGILHSTFVFMRLVQFFRIGAPALGSDEALFRLHRHLLGFYEGMQELEYHAQFTASGEALFRDMRNVRKEFQAALAEPDPRYYKRVGKDYVV